MAIKHNEGGSHFYTREGEPRHDAGLRDARKLGLFPSVTTIDKAVFPNRGIERYKIEQAIKAATSNPRQIHEDEDTYAQRLYDLSLDHSRAAAEFGSEVHATIEDWPQMPIDQRLLPWFNEFSAWYVESGLTKEGQEIVLTDNDIGVAGRVDWVGIHATRYRCVLDWKTQNIKPDDKGRKKPQYYPSWARQLAFYAVADAKKSGMYPQLPACASVVIDSSEPSKPHIKWWKNEDILFYYKQFVAGVWMYCYEHDYWPVGRWEINLDISLPV